MCWPGHGIHVRADLWPAKQTDLGLALPCGDHCGLSIVLAAGFRFDNGAVLNSYVSFFDSRLSIGNVAIFGVCESKGGSNKGVEPFC
jgi:hypothetical protein